MFFIQWYMWDLYKRKSLCWKILECWLIKDSKIEIYYKVGLLFKIQVLGFDLSFK